jgi:hypothetical protein
MRAVVIDRGASNCWIQWAARVPCKTYGGLTQLNIYLKYEFNKVFGRKL